MFLWSCTCTTLEFEWPPGEFVESKLQKYLVFCVLIHISIEVVNKVADKVWKGVHEIIRHLIVLAIYGNILWTKVEV